MKKTMSQRRPGFTLVEMLVATALIMFIMLILSEAFVQGIDAFRLLKGIGDMEARLRSATTLIRGDLVPDHFEGKRRLSDASFWTLINPNQSNVREGFVNVTQGFSPTASLAPIPIGAVTITPVAMSSLTWTIQPGTVLWIDPGPNQDYVTVQSTNGAPPASFNVLPQTPILHNHLNAPVLIRVVRQIEGVDADGLVVSRATDHVLHLAVKQRGNAKDKFFTANLPYSLPYPATSPFFPFLPNGNPNPSYTPTTFFDQPADGRYQDVLPQVVPNPPATLPYTSQWAEVAYFLWPNGTTAGGTPLFALYRCQFVVVPDNRYVNGQVYNLQPNAPPPIAFNGWLVDGYTDMSAGVTLAGNPPIPVYSFYSPSDLAQGNRVFSNFYNSSLGAAWRGAPTNPFPFDSSAPQLWSATLVATDVVSFDVQILSSQLNQQLGLVPDFTDIPGGQFDTASPQNNYPINAVRIILRVWDLKTQQTRQITMMQDM